MTSSRISTSIATLGVQEMETERVKDNEECDVFQELQKEGLLDSGLSALINEPRRIRVEAARLDGDIRDLALKHYSFFIEADKNRTFIRGELKDISGGIDTVMRNIPELSRACNGFWERATLLAGKHKRTRQTLHHHLQILDLLEIPQVMDACVRNDMFDEALELLAYSNKLEKRHKTRNHTSSQTLGSLTTPLPRMSPIILSIVSEVKQCANQLRDYLFEQLRGNIQLPTCLKIVSYLRRVDSLLIEAGECSTESLSSSEGKRAATENLRAHFLSCRESWLASAIDDIETEDAYQYTVNVIEKKRTTWFDMITQYRAIFGTEDEKGKLDALLASWAVRSVSDFVRFLESQLSLIEDGGQLANILEQCLFFGTSMSRVGADFRGLLAPLFQQKVIEITCGQWDNALEQLQEFLGLDQTTFSGRSASLQLWNASALSGSPLETDIAPGGASSATDAYAPPKSLLQCPALSVYTNGLLNGLNDLRRIALLSACAPLASHLQAYLVAAVKSMEKVAVERGISLLPVSPKKAKQPAAGPASNGDMEYSGINHRDDVTSLRWQLLRMASMFAEELVPYILKSFRLVFDGHEPPDGILSEFTILEELQACGLFSSPKLAQRHGKSFNLRALQRFRRRRSSSEAASREQDNVADSDARGKVLIDSGVSVLSPTTHSKAGEESPRPKSQPPTAVSPRANLPGGHSISASYAEAAPSPDHGALAVKTGSSTRSGGVKNVGANAAQTPAQYPPPPPPPPSGVKSIAPAKTNARGPTPTPNSTTLTPEGINLLPQPPPTTTFTKPLGANGVVQNSTPPRDTPGAPTNLAQR